MGLFSRSPSDIDAAMTLYGQADREDRTQRRNDQRASEGLSVQHCGVDAGQNQHGDYVCGRCNAIF